MKWCIISGLLCYGHWTYSQSASTLMGARAAGMGFTSSTLVDESVLFNNVGGMARLKESATFFAMDARPSLTGANRAAASLNLLTRLGVAGFGVFRFGDDLYREQMISIGFSNKFGLASLGIRANYIQYAGTGFVNRYASTLDFGGLAQITPQISIGAYIINLGQAQIASDRPLPTRMVAGIGFRLDESFFLTTEIDKDIAFDATWRSGIEYSISKKVFVRTGFNLNPRAAFFGLGSRAGRLRADYSIQLSAFLGSSHQVSAGYHFERREDHEN